MKFKHLLLIFLFLILSACTTKFKIDHIPTTTQPILPKFTPTTLFPSPPTHLDNTVAVPKSSDILNFIPGDQFLGDSISFSIEIADLDADGDNDIFIANYNNPSTLWLNNGDGTFFNSYQTFGPSRIQGAHDVAIQDLNGDGYLDIFLVYHKSPSKIFFNDGSGTFTNSGQDIGAANDDPQWVVLGDIDGDGDTDAFLVFSRQPNRLWVNDGSGVFTRSDEGYGGNYSHNMLLADFNGDNALDILYCFINQPGKVWFNDGMGDFSESGQTITDCGELDSGDIDGDGDIDFAVSTIDNGISIWDNSDGAGTFTQSGTYFYPGTIKLKLFDADLDGDLDLVASKIEEGNGLWINQGKEGFSFKGLVFGSDWAHCFSAGKIDSDEYLDVVVGYDNANGGLTIYFNR